MHIVKAGIDLESIVGLIVILSVLITQFVAFLKKSKQDTGAEKGKQSEQEDTESTVPEPSPEEQLASILEQITGVKRIKPQAQPPIAPPVQHLEPSRQKTTYSVKVELSKKKLEPIVILPDATPVPVGRIEEIKPVLSFESSPIFLPLATEGVKVGVHDQCSQTHGLLINLAGIVVPSKNFIVTSSIGTPDHSLRPQFKTKADLSRAMVNHFVLSPPPSNPSLY